jgi:hypothetical protein
MLLCCEAAQQHTKYAKQNPCGSEAAAGRRYSYGFEKPEATC